MKEVVISSRALYSAVLLYVTVVPCVAQVQCPGQPDFTGFDTVASLNAALVQEQNSIAGGGPINAPYVFTLCPDLTIDFSEESLTNVLDDVTFACASSDPLLPCIFSGGSTQVVIEDSPVPGYDITSVTFAGIVFEGFTGSAISGTASDTTMVTIADSIFRNVDGATSLINQSGSNPPFSVTVRDTNVEDVSVDTAFLNNGGALIMEDIDVSGVTAGTFIASANSAATQIDFLTVQESSIGTVVSASGSGTTLNARGTTVSNMVDLSVVFGSEANAVVNIVDTTITNNGEITDRDVIPNLANISPWKGFEVRTNSDMTVLGLIFNNNANVLRGFDVVRGDLEIRNANITATQGARNTQPDNNRIVSAAIYAQSEANVVATRVVFDDVQSFFSAYFGTQQAAVATAQNCFISAPVNSQNTINNDGVVFNSVDSTFTDSLTFVNNDSDGFLTNACNINQGRIVQGNEGCFDTPDSTSCSSFNCVEFADASATECLALLETEAPTSPPSIAPSQAPTQFQQPSSDFPSSVPSIVIDSDAPSTVPTDGAAPSSSPSSSAPPSVSASPSISSSPTIAPTTSAAPTTSRGPSVSPTLFPSESPSTSRFPSSSPSGSFAPTTSGPSSSPTVSFAPTTSGPSAVPTISFQPTLSVSPTRSEPTAGTQAPSAGCVPKPKNHVRGKGKGKGKGAGNLLRDNVVYCDDSTGGKGKGKGKGGGYYHSYSKSSKSSKSKKSSSSKKSSNSSKKGSKKSYGGKKYHQRI